MTSEVINLATLKGTFILVQHHSGSFYTNNPWASIFCSRVFSHPPVLHCTFHCGTVGLLKCEFLHQMKNLGVMISCPLLLSQLRHVVLQVYDKQWSNQGENGLKTKIIWSKYDFPMFNIIFIIDIIFFVSTNVIYPGDVMSQTNFATDFNKLNRKLWFWWFSCYDWELVGVWRIVKWFYG